MDILLIYEYIIILLIHGYIINTWLYYIIGRIGGKRSRENYDANDNERNNTLN
jgi:membrane protein DedA with SNARE-associated domain